MSPSWEAVLPARPPPCRFELTRRRCRSLKSRHRLTRRRASARPCRRWASGCWSTLAWEAFQHEPHQASYGTMAAWGSAMPYEQSFIYSPYGRGWHLDRRSFDAFLAKQAEGRGARVWRSTRVCRIDRADRPDAGWCLTLKTNDEPLACHARFLVDATGASARFARVGTARWIVADQLVALARVWDASERSTETIVEAFRDGWWYTAAIPGGRVVVCFTDPNLPRARRLAEPVSFARLLAQMPVISHAVGSGLPIGPIAARGVGSRYLDPAAGDRWLAVGDAASVFDPLSSQGMLKALRSGVFASYAIADCLVRGNPAGLDRYRQFVRREFNAYLGTRAEYYAQEPRWRDGPFWRRRYSGGDAAAPKASRTRPHSATT
jgi:flavin-dependent dehydrogenase